MKKLNLLLTFILMFLCYNINVLGQKWKEIVPSISTCEDVKKVFEVKECELPTSWYKFLEYNISITFSDGRSVWNTPKEKVDEVIVTLKKPIKLELYEANLTDYKIIPENDLPNYKIYANAKKGIKLTVRDYKEEGLWVYSIFLYPSEENRKKFKCNLSANKAQTDYRGQLPIR